MQKHRLAMLRGTTGSSWIQLARSGRYTVESECEVVELRGADRPNLRIGDFYGDPRAAVIDRRGRWVVTIGCGYIVYYIRKPFTDYASNRVDPQWSEGYNHPGQYAWIDAITLSDESDDEVIMTVSGSDVLSPGRYRAMISTDSVQLIRCDP
jgi:hypothetical protein